MSTKTVQARVDSHLKEVGDGILKMLGVTPSQAINAFYAQIVLCKGLPFEVKLPNNLTLEAIEELESGGGKKFSSFKSMIDDLEEDENA
ncbi:TPA: type II toxin-antitoxin system RelB/DinJ family antitoxin [Legionella pneumophila subsp. pneumophila]|jgi:DNA-damage-inducible protein J|uniref:type II toxin-antitoxin system RelB/DinJ family antitoxin n=1 Tax=Legionella TaxID=445 RepID=UPI0007709067|nr:MULTISPECIES: type II toxin-antitoxin system RelB/DinJ family antitoxin [Legionella]HAT9216373.1 type II toxin-antitoxin system RelB/DinJ family antitoxin [Legionella pneumophila subsp. pneumophila]MCW8421004.1 type II toxin-antitoxin system RelB/DinJ family antitoxin [Legionella sp. PATHC032]CZI17354.1 Antitoxin DinJ [Legionella pneumophila]HAT9262452.1 type II toxin-antitoxin system RelB/DinJ family antitoxin [Legionella pneumophila subsp. pneumophila]HAT9283868.1 type II toxin-antitoxin 